MILVFRVSLQIWFEQSKYLFLSVHSVCTHFGYEIGSEIILVEVVYSLVLVDL